MKVKNKPIILNSIVHFNFEYKYEPYSLKTYLIINNHSLKLNEKLLIC